MKKLIICLILSSIISLTFSQQSVGYYDIPNGGGTITLSPYNVPDLIIVHSSAPATLTNNWSINTSSAPPVGSTWKLVFDLTTINFNGHTVSFFGQTINSPQALSVGYFEFYIYDIGAGNVLGFNYAPYDFNAGNAISGGIIQTGTLPLSAFESAITRSVIDTTGIGRIWIGGASNTTTTLYAGGNAKLLVGNGTTLGSVAMSGDGTISNAGVLTIDSTLDNSNLKTGANIQRQKLEVGTGGYVLINGGAGYMSEEATLNPSRGGLGANVSGSTGFVTFSSGSSTVGSIAVDRDLDVSFESGEVGDFKIYMGFAGTLVNIYSYATKVIAGTDNGTIVAKNAAGTTMATGTITYTASDPRGTAYTVVPSTNNTFSSGDVITFTTAKTTAGGKVHLSLKFTRNL